MHLKSLQLENFRNHKSLNIELDKDKPINLFVGDNAQGKTNFLEAITILALTKSFRNKKANPLIEWDSDYARIVGEIAISEDNFEKLEYFVDNKKNLRKNGVDVPVKDFIGTLNIVLFHPEDLNMLCLSPSLRRKFVDMVLSQIDPLYFDALVSYNRIVKQRNKALQMKVSVSELSVWDEKLAEYGTYILKKRNELIDFYNTIVSDHYNKISNSKNEIVVKYVATIDPDNYMDELAASLERDMRYCQTTKGIHRDDIEFEFNGRNISDFGSRGEMRTLILALKLMEIGFIEKETGHKPILLLDDVFSELDQGRQKYLLEAIKGYQSFITTTHHDFPLDEDTQVFKLENGVLI